MVTILVIGVFYEYYIKIHLEIEKELKLEERRNIAKLLQSFQKIAFIVGDLTSIHEKKLLVPDNIYQEAWLESVGKLKGELNKLLESISLINIMKFHGRHKEWITLTSAWHGRVIGRLKYKDDEHSEIIKISTLVLGIYYYWSAKYNLRGLFFHKLVKLHFFYFNERKLYKSLYKDIYSIKTFL